MRPTIARFLVAAAFGAGPFAAAAAQGDEAPLWSQVGDWEVRVDMEIGYGCFAVTGYEDGSVLRMGLDPLSHGAYLVFAGSDLDTLEEGRDYELELRFGDARPWTAVASARGVVDGAPPALIVPFEDPQVVVDFMKKRFASLRHDGREIVRLSLKGSYDAFAEVIACQGQMSEAFSDPDGDDGSGGAPPPTTP